MKFGVIESMTDFFFFFVFYVVSGWSCVLSCLSPAVFYDFIFMRHNKFAYSISVQYFGLLLCLQVYVSVKKKIAQLSSIAKIQPEACNC